MDIVDYKRDGASDQLRRIRARSLDTNADLIARVAEIVEGVRSGGNEALIHYTRQFDVVELKAHELRVDREFIRQQAARADAHVIEAFRRAIGNIRTFHENQKERDWQMTTEHGAIVGQRVLPVASAGLYVPGGRAAYPSSVAMSAIPAQVAGVRRIAIATPPGT